MESVLNMIFLTVFVLFVIPASGVIYRLNDTEYKRLPPLFHLEEFYPCMRGPGDLYCYVNAKLVANHTSELLSIIQDYSAYNVTHYDHTIVHRGLCVSQSCRAHNSSDLEHTLEACLNASLFSSHHLQVKLIKEKVYCTRFHEEVILDPGDFVVAAVLLWLLLLNVVGSLFDYCCYNGSNHFVVKLLLCFSTKRNWERLVMPSGEGPDPKMRRLKCFNGIKTITTALVILGHSPLSVVLSTNNPDFIENTYHSLWFSIIYNGTLIVQSFFFISGFLLAYNILLMGEKRRVGWETLPRGIVLRWLRMTPPYAVVLAFVSTWLRHLGNGPLWKPTVEVEVADCRREWYYNLLYVNNYIDNSQCMAHTWYLAADMQLTVLGLMIFCLLHSARARKIAVGIMFVVGLLTPAVSTYLQNLHAVLLVAPEVARNIFVMDPTFNNLYKRGHTNIVCYAYGMAFGMLILHLQNTNFNLMKYKKYRPVFWSAWPLKVLLIMSGGIFYIDGIQVAIGLRMIYASGVKLLFGVLSSVIIGGSIFKFENVYRSVLEWRGWSALGRISYCAYLVHVCVIRTTVANHTSLIHSSVYLILLNYLGVLVISFLVATPCWMFIEAPFAQLVKVCLNPGSEAREKNKTVTMASQINITNGKETSGC